MKTTFTLTTPDVTLTQAKAFVRADGNIDDTLITDLIKQATEEAFSHSGIMFGDWSVEVKRTALDENGDFCRVYLYDGAAVNTVVEVYVDDTVIDSADYTFNNLTQVLTLADTVAEGEVLTVTYGVAAPTPYDVQQAILQHVKQAYDYGDNLEWKSSRFFDRVLNRYRTNYTG